MVRIQRSVMLDEGVNIKIQDKADEEEMSFSSMLNNILKKALKLEMKNEK